MQLPRIRQYASQRDTQHGIQLDIFSDDSP